ncbi:hypothetical protein DFS34DRAFT_618337 [Phlyctochytrium arcticum]|nr:hypothetical protein DFS34DRAFT_618337 [Phlyctochytrium arcticum]
MKFSCLGLVKRYFSYNNIKNRKIEIPSARRLTQRHFVGAVKPASNQATNASAYAHAKDRSSAIPLNDAKNTAATGSQIILQYIQQGKLSSALTKLDKVVSSGETPSLKSLTLLVKAYQDLGIESTAASLERLVLVIHAKLDIQFCGAIVHHAAKRGDIAKVDTYLERIADQKLRPSKRFTDGLLSGLATWAPPDTIIPLIDRLIEQGFPVGNWTLNVILRSYQSQRDLNGALSVLRGWIQDGRSCHVNDFNVVINLSAELLGVEHALSLIEVLQQVDGFVANTRTMNILIKHALVLPGATEACRKIFSFMKDHGIVSDLVTWNTLLALDGGCDANSFLSGLNDNGLHADVFTLLILMKRYSRNGDLDKVGQLFKLLQGSTSGKDALRAWTILIDAHCRAGSLSEALSLFEKLKATGYQPDTVLYTCLISAYVRADRVEMAHALWEQLIQSGCVPSCQTYTSLVNAYAIRGDAIAIQALLADIEARDLLPDHLLYSRLLKFADETYNSILKEKILTYQRCHPSKTAPKPGPLPACKYR